MEMLKHFVLVLVEVTLFLSLLVSGSLWSGWSVWNILLSTSQWFAFSEPVNQAAERLGYVRNPRSLMEGTETLCRDDIGDLPGSPEHLRLRENANEIG